MNKGVIKGIVIQIISGICYGSMGVVSIFLMRYGMDFIHITMTMFLAIFLISFAKTAATDIKGFLLPKKFIMIALVQGVIIQNGLRLLFFYALKFLPPGICSVMIFCMVFPLMYFSSIFFGEKITLPKIILSVIALAGVMLVLNVFEPSSVYSIKGITIMFICILFSVVNNITNKLYTSKEIDVVAVSVYMSLAGFVTLLISTSSGHEYFGVIIQYASDISFVYTIIIFAIVSAGAVVLLMYGLNFMSAAHMGICQAMDPITAMVLGIITFANKFTLLQIAGVVLILFSVIYLSFTED